VNITWGTGHGIRDRATVPNAFDGTAPGAIWSYRTTDTVPPSAATVVPPPFVMVRSLKQITVTFDEPVIGVEAGDLLVNDLPAQEVSGAGAGPYTFAFSQPATGQVQVAWAPGHGIQDVAAAPMRLPAGRGPTC